MTIRIFVSVALLSLTISPFSAHSSKTAALTGEKPFAGGQNAETLNLSQALDYALANHPLIGAAQAGVASANAAGRKLTAPYKPLISLNAYFSDGNGSMIFPSTVSPINFMRVPAQASAMQNTMLMWKLYSGGRDHTARRLAKTQVATAKSAQIEAVLDVRLGVRLAFAQVLLKKESVEAEKIGLDAATELERVTRERFEAGKVPEAFVFRAKADLSRASRRATMAEAELLAAIAALKAAIGTPQSDSLELGEWDQDLPAPNTLDEALLAALQNRPELAYLGQQRDSFSLRSRMTGQSNLPEISIMAMNDFMDSALLGSSTQNKLSLIVSFPLSDGGLRRAQEEESRALAKQADMNLSAMELLIQSQVAAAWALWKSAPAVLHAAESEVRASAEAYRIAKLRYETGKAIQVEVSEALADMVGAFVGEAEAREYQRRAWAQLSRAVGA